MRTHIHGGRRSSPEIPWLLVATIVGIIVVVVVALFFFTGLGGSSAGHTASSTATAQTTTSAATSSGTSGSSSAIVVVTTTPVTIPATGVYVQVDYIGGFTGTYTTNGETTKEADSGIRMYPVTNATGTVTAVFQKNDNTATHPLTVSIYKNGSQLASNSTSASYGKVTVTAGV
ncbi:MAG: hypothetical protein WCE46_03105 [Methanoregula sp.]|uniref:hypothetical protein n=1 Tax=Methanoregula sp. TaxID=2052170 RepID=UPI003C76C756